MPPIASKFCHYTFAQLEELMEHLRFQDEEHMKSHDYMMAFKERLVKLHEKKQAEMEFERRLDECERQRAQYDKKLITFKDMAPDRCLRDDTVAEHSFSKTVDVRYHKSDFLDPFGVLGLANATPVNESEQQDTFAVTGVYRRTYDDPELRALGDSQTVEELYQHADNVIFKTTDGCKS